MYAPPDLSQLGFTDLPAVEQSLARSLPNKYSPRMIKTPMPLSRSVTRASPLRKVWPEAQSSRPQSAEEIEVLAQLSDATKRLRLADSVLLSSTLRTTVIVCDLGREMDLLESMDKMLLICRAPRSEALLIIMAEVLDLTLKRASSRVASCVDMLQANQALRFCGRSKHADASVFDELDRCLRLCAETAARPAHRPFLLQCTKAALCLARLHAWTCQATANSHNTATSVDCTNFTPTFGYLLAIRRIIGPWHLI